MSVPKKFQFQNIHEVDVPDEMRVKNPCGIDYVDNIFGGGFTKGTQTLFTALPGAGKTTLMLLVADAMASKGYTVCFNSTEEDIRQVKMTVERLGLGHAFYCANLENVENIIKSSKAVDCDVLIVDSIQTTGSSVGKTGSETCQREVVTQINEYAKQDFIMAFMIGHVTKSGKMAGHQGIKHQIDTHLHMHLVTNPRDNYEMGTRIVTLEKNRFGPTANQSYLFLGPNGFWEVGYDDVVK